MRNAALLGTRLVVGSYLAVHGAQKLFGGSGLDQAVAGAVGGGLLAVGLVARILTAKSVAPANSGAAVESAGQPSGQVTTPQ